ncbi:MAG: SDR family oxidoreductase [Rhodoferax sp.]|uniref:SDR family oxidoreductase n=1 Tax=Rhodoferax sp. TaxID=50421 RepID=UPI0014016CA6|nr:SDR family oxidoreductase [Rhodoferax sp.]NDP39224.1 SDR family oxidoreductase [Rhodoferax sp.]
MTQQKPASKRDPQGAAKSVFITGASSGLGRQMAIEFSRRGYCLALTARRLDVLKELQAELAASGGGPVFVAALDVTDELSVVQVLAQASAQLGSLDIVVANAGIGHHGAIGKLPFDRVRDTINTNVIGFMATVDAAMHQFKAQGHGHLVGISSVAAFRGMPAGGVYGASKAAVTTYLESLRAETHSSPIVVTTLSPGFIDTPINRGAKSRPFVIGVERGGKLLVDLIERQVQQATVPRWPWSVVARLMAVLPTSVIAKLR